jgi:hypothetical protein
MLRKMTTRWKIVVALALAAPMMPALACERAAFAFKRAAELRDGGAAPEFAHYRLVTYFRNVDRTGSNIHSPVRPEMFERYVEYVYARPHLPPLTLGVLGRYACVLAQVSPSDAVLDAALEQLDHLAGNCAHLERRRRHNPGLAECLAEPAKELILSVLEQHPDS